MTTTPPEVATDHRGVAVACEECGAVVACEECGAVVAFRFSDRSSSQSKLVAALIEARKGFEAIKKTKQGQEGHQKYKYAPLDAVHKATLGALNAQGLDVSVSTRFVDDDIEVTSRLDHISGEWRVSSVRFTRPLKDGHEVKNMGKMLTYGTRYTYQMVIGITTEDDTDGPSSQRQQAPAARQQQPSDPVTRMRGLLRVGKLGDVISGLIRKVAKSGKSPKVGAISPKQRQRLYAAAGQAQGWKSDALKASCQELFGVGTDEIGWDVYPLIVAFFEEVPPDQVGQQHLVDAGQAPTLEQVHKMLKRYNLSYPGPKGAQENCTAGTEPMPDRFQDLNDAQRLAVYDWAKVQGEART